jgi:hypothetical protein
LLSCIVGFFTVGTVMVLHIRSLVVGAIFALTAASARADDTPPPVIVRGTIASIDAASISIVRPDGTTVTASLAPNASFSTVEPRNFEDIKATDFVGITTVPGLKGALKAQEIHILPTKGLNEGSYPWDHQPGAGKPPAAASGITNGTVAVVHDEQPDTYTMTNASVAGSSGMQLKVTYHGSTIVDGKCVGRASKTAPKPCTGVATVEVSPETPIVAVVPGKPTDARVGLAVFAAVVTQPRGKSVATRLVVEKNGRRPGYRGIAEGTTDSVCCAR